MLDNFVKISKIAAYAMTAISVAVAGIYTAIMWKKYVK